MLRLRDTDLHWREIDGEVIALEARGSTYLAANGAGTLLWRALAEGTTRRARRRARPRYGIDRARAADDRALRRAADRAGPARRVAGQTPAAYGGRYPDAAMRVAVVTGVGRRAGIGFAIARRLLDDGYGVLAHAWPEAEATVREELGPDVAVDRGRLRRSRGAGAGDRRRGGGLRRRRCARRQPRDRLAATSLAEVTAAELDRTFAVNARAVVLLVQAFAAQGRRDGRVVLVHVRPAPRARCRGSCLTRSARAPCTR